MELLDKPLQRLSADELWILRDIRDSLPGVTPDTILQKVIPQNLTHRFINDLGAQIDLNSPDAAAQLAAYDRLVRENPDVMGVDPAQYAATELRGFVSRSIDVGDLDPRGTFDGTGLGYEGTPFGDASRQYVPRDYFAIEFEAGPDLKPSTAHYVTDAIEANHTELSKLDGLRYETRVKELVESQHIAREPRPTNPKALEAWEASLAKKLEHVTYALDANNLHRGNGFGGGRGNFNPELQILDKAPVPTGAEMWKISQDGTRTLVARMGAGDKWEIAL